MTEIINILIIVLSAIFVLFLPGLSLSLVFFRPGKIDLIERIALSFALSISVIPLVAFYLNLLGVKISKTSVILEVVAISLIALVTHGIQLKIQSSKLKAKK